MGKARYESRPDEPNPDTVKLSQKSVWKKERLLPSAIKFSISRRISWIGIKAKPMALQWTYEKSAGNAKFLKDCIGSFTHRSDV